MEIWLDALEATQLAHWLRFSRWGYAIINTLHILGIALLVGAIIPLDLKLIGLTRRLNLETFAQILVPTAIVGLSVSVLSGTLLFITGANDYAQLTLFLFKLSCITLAVVNAIYFHWRIGYAAAVYKQQIAGSISLLLWLCALVSGRFIAFI